VPTIGLFDSCASTQHPFGVTALMRKRPCSRSSEVATLYVISGAEGMTAAVWHLKIRASRGLECSRTSRREPGKVAGQKLRVGAVALVSGESQREPYGPHMRAWTRREVLVFEAGLNVKESLDLCHIYRQPMAKGKWPVCLPPSTLNVCTSDKCFVRYTSHGTLAVGLKLAVCVDVFSGQGKGGVSISWRKSNTFGETRKPVPFQPQCVPLEVSPI